MTTPFRVVLVLSLQSWALPQASAQQAARSYSSNATRLHHHLFDGYVAAAPASSARRVEYSSIGTDVGVQIRIFKVVHVEAGLLVAVVFIAVIRERRPSQDPNASDLAGEVRLVRAGPVSTARCCAQS